MSAVGRSSMLVVDGVPRVGKTAPLE